MLYVWYVHLIKSQAYLGNKWQTRFCRVGFLEINLLWNTLPGIRKWNMFPRRQILGNQHIAVGSTGISVGTDALHMRPFRSEWSLQGWGSRIWDSKIWSWVPRDSDLRITALVVASSNVNGRRILSPERMLHNDYYLKDLVEKNLWLWVWKDLTPRQTDWWQIASRKVTSTLNKASRSLD
jgi:hypothetical protein